jgi:CRISPR-associated exonuclease Cas4
MTPKEKVIELDIGGLMIQYCVICPRKLWFYANRAGPKQMNRAVNDGKRIDESTYQSEKKHVFIDGRIAIDFLSNGRVVEVKRSSDREDASVAQIKFYLWYLQELKDVETDGVIRYPSERDKKHVELTREGKRDVENMIDTVFKVGTRESPPKAEEIPAGGKCAYYDMCWV